MKKWLIGILIASLVVLTNGCKNENEKSEKSNPVSSELEQTAAEKEAAEKAAAEKEAADQAAAEKEAAEKAAALREENLKKRQEREAEKAAKLAAELEEIQKSMEAAREIGEAANLARGYVEPDDENNPKLPATITYLGRSTLIIEFADGIVAYIDPYAGTSADYEIPADLVLVTHQHGDHNKTEYVTLKEGGQIVNCPDDIVYGDTIELFGLTIQAVPAYNDNHKKDECCGYLIKFGEMTLYHAGDTSYIPEMEDLAKEYIDYAFLPMDDFWNMGPEEALEVADTILAEVVVPIHTDSGSKWDQENADDFEAVNKVILTPRRSMIIE